MISPKPETNIYSVALRDKARSYKVTVTKYPVEEKEGRKFYIQFIQLWGKKVKVKTLAGETVEGYLHKVEGNYKLN